jgi:hypothetical protein
MVFQAKPALIACDDMVAASFLHSLRHGKKLTAFCDRHLPQVIFQLVQDPVVVKIFIASELCKRSKTVSSNMFRASTIEYAEHNGSFSKHARILASR